MEDTAIKAVAKVRLSHLTAGFIAVLISYTGSAALVWQAAQAAGASPEMLASWLWALGIGIGSSGIVLSLLTRSPVLTGWSTPGAALLATSLVGVSLSDAIGAFAFASVLMALAGGTGAIERIMRLVPKSIAAAMLAGVLLRFGLAPFVALAADKVLVGAMILSFFAGRRFVPRYAIPLTLVCGIAVVLVRGGLSMTAVRLSLALPIFTMPTFSPAVLLGVGLPLFVVTLASQNVPGIAVLRAYGYGTSATKLLTWTGCIGVLIAPFGGFSLNIAAITASICMTEEVDPDPAQRFRSTVWAGGIYLLTGLFGATVVGLLNVFPQLLITAFAGLALIGTIGNSLVAALESEADRDRALVTFLITASGLTLFGVGSAFWGLLFGISLGQLQKR